jgi:hypothetical protein
MNRLVLSVVCLALALPAARAYEPEPGSLMALAANPKVQTEIELTPAQAAEVMKLAAGEEKGAEAALLKLLKRLQIKRLRELSLQARGGAALTEPTVQEALKLRDDQKAKIGDVWKNKELSLAMIKKVARFRNKAVEAAWVLRNRRENGEALIALLDDGQKKAFAALQGRPFKF